ncbi:hypothetical protein D6855_13745 [Butyrivibrio sp. CB08]|uniref:InlB B-repeat-containing protein n=1 Tax=Butyrivibrio sp. CB08 TaxID=2364879 RepID=UPI000EA93258|nr:InlB B-repeat-containing protein [Butyrivibrio sp. CB08]RKM57602.1 hypothetical protein D6855_13745 [Butyrivibrio sp. CB08]
MKKINRLLAFLLAFAVVITTFSSDLTTAKVFATEEETVIDTEGTINTVEKEEIETPVVSEASTEESTEETTTAPTAGEGTGAGENEEVVNDDASTTGTDVEGTDPALVEEAVEEEEKEAEEVREKEFKESKTIDGIVISLYADPEVLPDDATLEIYKVEDEDEAQIKELIDDELGDNLKVEKTFSYDITIVSKETGEVYKPEDGTVDVKFSRIQEAAPKAVAMEVYHVNDELTEAESVSEVVEEGTEISFDAEHFSIYSVTLYYWYGYVNINAGVYDINGNAIEKDNSIRKINMKSDWDLPYQYPAAVAPIMNGYTFDHATINDKNINFFYIWDGYLYASVEGSEYDQYVNPNSSEAVKFFYNSTNPTAYVTTDHIDLGFTDDEMPKVKKVEVSINGKVFEMGAGVTEDDLGVVEKRLSLPASKGQGKDKTTISSVSTSDTIIFYVTVEDAASAGPGFGPGPRPGAGPGSSNNKKVYEYTCTEADNKNAYERCINSHTYRQEKFGFDYKFNFREKFNYGAKIQYHNNWGSDATKDVSVNWETQTQGGKKTAALVEKAQYATVVTGPNSDCTFLGWGTTPNATQYVTEVEVENGKTTHVYAIWQKYTVKFKDADDNKTISPDQIVYQGGTATVVATPKDKGNKTFAGWKVKNKETDSKPTKDFKFTDPITKDITVYATYKEKKIPVAVYATDGISSSSLTDHNAKLRDQLKLGWVQDDGYFPLGVIWIDQATVDAGLRGNVSTVINAIDSIDTSYLQNAGLANKGNTVVANKSKIKLDTDGHAKSYKTAFFRWNNQSQGDDPEHIEQSGPNAGKTNIKIPDGYTKFAYHLDVRFATNNIEYIGEYYENNTKIANISDKKLTEVSYFDEYTIIHPSMDSYKNGYEFIGFFTDQNCTKPFTATTVTSSLTVYAKFKKVVQFDVTYTDGVNNEVVFADQKYTVDKDSDAPAFVAGDNTSIPKRTGYKFTGWKSSAENNKFYSKDQKLPKVTKTVTYTAQWEADFAQYKVEYYKQNVDNAEYTLVSTATKTFTNKKTGETATYNKSRDNILALGEVKSGFAYVETKANLTGDKYSKITDDNDIKVRADGNLVIQVYFKRNTYKVTYNYDDKKGAVKGITPANAPVDKTEYRYGQTVTVDTTKVTATGYTFEGWYLGSDKKSTFVITADTELVGKFETKKNIKYTIKYFQQNAENDDYTEVKADKLDRTGNYTENVRYEDADRSDDKYVGFNYAKTKVLLTGSDAVEYGKDDTIPAIAVPAEDDKLVIEVYYDRKVYEVTYAYVGDDIPKIVDPTEAELAGYTKKYRYQQLVTVEADAEAPGYTFKGWKARPVSNGEALRQEVTAVSATPTSIPSFLLFFKKLLTGEDGTQTSATAFRMPASDVRVEGSFDKTPYNVVLELKGNTEGDGFDYEKVYNATEQSADIDFNLVIYMEGSDEPLTALNVNSANYNTLMASLDKAMSLGTLTVYAAEGELFEDISTDTVKRKYTGEEQEVAKSVTKKITVDGREYSVTVDLAGGKGTRVRDYDIYVKNISFKLGDKDITDLGIFKTDIEVNDVVGKLSITPATLTITADDKYKDYGASDPVFTARVSGLLGSDADSQQLVDDYLKEFYIFNREPGESAGGKYAIHVKLPFADIDNSDIQPVELPERLQLRSNNVIIVGYDELPPVMQVLNNYLPAYADGTLTIGTTGDDDEWIPRDPDADSYVAAPAPAVLGAQRQLPAEQPAVLGARRAGTSDTSIIGSIITIIVAAAIAFSMIFIKRKKKEEQ